MPSKRTSVSDRVDRLTEVVYALAEETRAFQTETRAFQAETVAFQLAVRGAITTQQEQIAENNRQIAALLEMQKASDRKWQELRRRFDAYLNTIHPKQ